MGVTGAGIPDLGLQDFVLSCGLMPACHSPCYSALTGGVSSDVWKVEGGDRPFVVKKALARLRVAQEWTADVARSDREADYFEFVGRLLPDHVPQVLARAQGMFAMPYFSSQTHLLWKDELRQGRVDPEFAAALGAALAAIHSQSAARPALLARFRCDADFHALRLAPYLEATAQRHPDLSEHLQALVQTTLRHRHALVHGDVSPKNILMRRPSAAYAGTAIPVLLDAECAWHGDPAFDLAFCLNHLWLKSVWVPSAKPLLELAFQQLAQAYRCRVDWEDPRALEARTAALLPALLLARVDGKSPVEYLDEAQRERVRRCARGLLLQRPTQLADVEQAWREER